MIPQQTQPTDPMDRVQQQYSFCKSKGRDMVAITLGDLEYLMNIIRTTASEMEQQKPQAS